MNTKSCMIISYVRNFNLLQIFSKPLTIRENSLQNRHQRPQKHTETLKIRDKQKFVA